MRRKKRSRRTTILLSRSVLSRSVLNRDVYDVEYSLPHSAQESKSEKEYRVNFIRVNTSDEEYFQRIFSSK